MKAYCHLMLTEMVNSTHSDMNQVHGSRMGNFNSDSTDLEDVCVKQFCQQN